MVMSPRKLERVDIEQLGMPGGVQVGGDVMRLWLSGGVPFDETGQRSSKPRIGCGFKPRIEFGFAQSADERVGRLMAGAGR